jgi:antitoxin MazE
MRAKITKWGDSLALRLPRSLAEEVGFSERERVDLVVEGGALKITLSRKEIRRKKFGLCDLLANQGRTSAVGWGKAEGNEAW